MVDASRAALLLLADGRLPAGGHAHSGGIEAATGDGSVTDLTGLERFLRGRLATTGLVSAAFTAATCRLTRSPHTDGNLPVTISGQPSAAPPRPSSNRPYPEEIATSSDTDVASTVTTPTRAIIELDVELDARTPSPAQRSASRAQGRALLRAGRAAWPGLSCPVPAPHHPVAFGLVAAHAGLSPADAALAVAYGTVSGPASAATRLLGLDPLAVTALLTRLTPAIDRTATEAAALSNHPPADLPATTAPRLELLAEHHHTATIRMFAS
ncbi:urease accessory protein UreF [Protofrankia sp. BMG5.30]|uniref:urease accessory protein UreF n=1 Tax=Protofrankia sp. BMG5.30 TaxID=1834514 RepID=UPI0009786897|nr:urease accessory UreF family protein [Protofrankia sp. BMG5.30]ONH34212.1 urease accessory protein [Protofrankia sp. BMG5.30]